MKTVKDLCKATGVTRKTLRGYNDIGLLCPVNLDKKQNKNSALLYDDSALTILKIILIYTEAGYERKEIKQIFDSVGPEQAFMSQYKNLKDALLERRRQIDGMINYLDLLTSVSQKLPEAALRAFAGKDFSWPDKLGNFSKVLHETVDRLSEFSNADMDEMVTYFPFLYKLMAIDALRELPPDSKDVQECVHSLVVDMLELVDFDHEFEDATECPEEVKFFIGIFAVMASLKELSGEQEAAEMKSYFFKDGDFTFVKQALQQYYDKYKYVDTMYELGFEENLK